MELTAEQRTWLREAVSLELRKRTDPRPSCKGCNQPYSTHTPKCRACTYRHFSRRRRGTKDMRQHGSCTGCRCPYDNYTDGCYACWERHSKRKLRQKAA